MDKLNQVPLPVLPGLAQREEDSLWLSLHRGYHFYWHQSYQGGSSWPKKLLYMKHFTVDTVSFDWLFYFYFLLERPYGYGICYISSIWISSVMKSTDIDYSLQVRRYVADVRGSLLIVWRWRSSQVVGSDVQVLQGIQRDLDHVLGCLFYAFPSTVARCGLPAGLPAYSTGRDCMYTLMEGEGTHRKSSGAHRRPFFWGVLYSYQIHLIGWLKHLFGAHLNGICS